MVDVSSDPGTKELTAWPVSTRRVDRVYYQTGDDVGEIEVAVLLEEAALGLGEGEAIAGCQAEVGEVHLRAVGEYVAEVCVEVHEALCAHERGPGRQLTLGQREVRVGTGEPIAEPGRDVFLEDHDRRAGGGDRIQAVAHSG